MKVLALDLGSTVGWAVMDQAGRLDYGHEEFTGDGGERYAAFRQWLRTALARLEGQGVFIAFEDVRFNRGRSYIPGQTAILMAMCVDRTVPYVGVGVSELKKWATGNGNAPKEDMVEAATEWTDGEPATEDEADAIHVAGWARENAMRGAV